MKEEKIVFVFQSVFIFVVGCLVGIILADIDRNSQSKEPQKEVVTIPMTMPIFGITPNDSISDVESMQKMIDIVGAIADVNTHLDFTINMPAGTYIIDKSINGGGLDYYAESQSLLLVGNGTLPIDFSYFNIVMQGCGALRLVPRPTITISNNEFTNTGGVFEIEDTSVMLMNYQKLLNHNKQ